MAAIIVAFLLSAGMLATIWLALGRRRLHVVETRLPGQLSAAERRRLYHRLGIDPAALAKARHSNVIWLDPNVIDKRTDA